jgi:1,2-diacylglycerol 3-alpha-glucosyltransferase
MRILHLCLSNFYVDGYSYQENELVRQNVSDEHETLVIASTETINSAGDICYADAGRYFGEDGAWVERVRYRRGLPHIAMRKLRMHPGIYRRIEAFAPDVILFHSACGWEIRTAARYVRNHPHVKLYVDSHEDFVNSARGPISKWLLHYAYYRPTLRSCLDQIEKVLPVNVGAIEFMRDFYGVPPEMIELYPLGSQIEDDQGYAQKRREIRDVLGVTEEQTLIVQSGKIDASKKLVEALQAFAQNPDAGLRFVIAGLIKPDVKQKVDALIATDARVTFLGWKSADELRAILCAADVYCQPGTQSATMQMSLACRCAVVIDDVASHTPYFENNGWLVGKGVPLAKAFAEISADRSGIADMQARSHQVALRMLDYRLLAARIYR